MTWFAPVLLFFVVVSVRSGTEDFYFPVLDPPKNLAVGNASDTSVVVSWDYPKTRKVSLRRLEFVLLLENSQHPVRSYNLRFSSRPLNFTVESLLPNTAYTVRLVVTSLNWRDSSTASAHFTTLRRDWPTPVVTELSQKNDEEFAKYFVEWEIDTLMPQLTHFEIEVCGDSCLITRCDRTDNSTRVNVNYNTYFTLRVIASYDLPVLDRIKRSSTYFQRYSGPGIPARILTAPNAMQMGNRIKLRWHPWFALDGPITYYEFLVSDPTLTSGMLENNAVHPDQSRIKLHFPDEIGDVYDLRLDVGDESLRELLQRREDELGGKCEFDSCDTRSKKPDAGTIQPYRRTDPLFLSVLEKTRSTVRFRVVFQKSGLSEAFRSEMWKRHLNIGPGVALRFGFSANTMLKYKIRSCLSYEGTPFSVCGNYTEVENLSNVGEPSRVRGLSFHFRSPESVVIHWEEPEIPRGPIDGYEVLIRRTHGTAVGDEKKKLSSAARSYVIESYQPQTKYEVRVAAYNLDPWNDNELLRGEWERVHPTPKSLYWWLLLFGTSVFLISVIAVACTRRRPRRKIALVNPQQLRT